MAEQKTLPLDAGLQALYGTAGQRLLAIAKRVIRESDAKQGADFASRLGISGPHLSDALNGNGKHFALTWLPQVIHLDRDHSLLNYAAGLVSRRVVPIAPLTPAQRLDMLIAELKRSGADVEALEARAYGRTEPAT